MEWLELLKGFVKAKLSAKVSLTANPNVGVSTQGRKKKQKVTFKNKGNVLALFVDSNTTPEVVEQLKETLLPAFEKNQIAFIEEDSQALLQGYKNYQKNSDSAEVVQFFAGKISTTDHTLLQTGLYIEYLVVTGQPSASIKNNVIARYGERGKNVVNLASAGYFQSHIQPLYEALSNQPNFSPEVFTREYERIVTDMPFAIFVHSGQTDQTIIDEVIEKAERNIKYGVSEETIVLHGYGNNADTIERLVPQLQERFSKIATETKFLGDLKVTTASIYYKQTTTVESQ